MKKIQSALISVFYKDGIDAIARVLHNQGVTIYSTGGTEKYILDLGIPVEKVEDLTSYPSILDGRVKTLHPKVFGGILARREQDHLEQLEQYQIPEIDLVIVDLYPFEETVANTRNEAEIIEKIDIGGISLIRAAAKNYNDVVVIPSKDNYQELVEVLQEQNGATSIEQRKKWARDAFQVSSHYDTAIHNYFLDEVRDAPSLKVSINQHEVLRYGENPHQEGIYFGDIDSMFDVLSGKALSYNNLVDVDAAALLMREFKDERPTFAVLKHTNSCGVATRDTVLEAWKDALAGDPISAFGGILICNKPIDLATAEEIDKIFYEVLLAPDFDQDAVELLTKKKKRILMKIKHYDFPKKRIKSILNGAIEQDDDSIMESPENFTVKTEKSPTTGELVDLDFANKCAKHLKSNTIVLVKNQQLLGMGCGQTSRVDACEQAIAKAIKMGFSLNGAVMASDAFFPFPDCVELADRAGITSVIQPGGSIKDNMSIAYCNQHEMSMVFTGNRHFKH